MSFFSTTVSSSKPKISRIEVNEMILDDGNKEKSSKRKRAKKDSEVLKTGKFGEHC